MTTNVIGRPLPRVDGSAKVTGSARYAADFNQQGQAYAVIVSATVGLGRVTGIEEGIAVLVDFGSVQTRILSPYTKLTNL